MLRKITTLFFILSLLLSQLCCYMHAHPEHGGGTAGSAASHLHLLWDAGSSDHVHGSHVHGSHAHGSHAHPHLKGPKSTSDSKDQHGEKTFDALAEGDHAVFGLIAILVPPSSWNDSGVYLEQGIKACYKTQPECDLGDFIARSPIKKGFAFAAALYLHHCCFRR